MFTKYFAILFCVITTVVFSQTDSQIDSAGVQKDSIVIDSVTVIEQETNCITNPNALTSIFEKLYALEQKKKGKINIVHIGDSHIQADIFSAVIRENLQDTFGNGGFGFSFPYRLAKTNGSTSVRFKSNTEWEHRRNVYTPEKGMEVGLSGIALNTKEDFVLETEVRDTAYSFNTIKLITPYNLPLFDLATSSKDIVIESKEPKVVSHKIKSGEVLSVIARKYNTSVSAIKQANGMRSNTIYAGKVLKIPTGEMEKKTISRLEFIPLQLEADSLSYYYHSQERLSKIYILPTEGISPYELSGIVLENDNSGIIYHGIGVNGAKAVDYNKYPLFFKQLPALQPDLIIISLGTNESFEKIETDKFITELNTFIANIKTANPNACVLVMTPPPSLFKKRYPNTFAGSYSNAILEQESEAYYASWDLFSEMGGLYSVPDNAKKGLMSTDRIHYSVQGYELQGELFTESFLKAYNNFKLMKEDAVD